jgi:hypothetical protein
VCTVTLKKKKKKKLEKYEEENKDECEIIMEKIRRGEINDEKEIREEKSVYEVTGRMR